VCHAAPRVAPDLTPNRPCPVKASISLTSPGETVTIEKAGTAGLHAISVTLGTNNAIVIRTSNAIRVDGLGRLSEAEVVADDRGTILIGERWPESDTDPETRRA
jgi:hypothetical protein